MPNAEIAVQSNHIHYDSLEAEERIAHWLKPFTAVSH